MTDAIIVLNAGSSSLKFSIFAVADQQRLDLVARGQIEGLGSQPRFKVKDHQDNVLAVGPVSTGGNKPGHAEAFAHVSSWIQQHYARQYTPIAVGHRIVHGGSRFAAPTLVDSKVLKELRQLIPLAPLHQPHNLEAIGAVMQSHPKLQQVACFDTAFHHGRASWARRFGLPEDLFQQGIQRWGFHGLSYESIARRLPEIAPDLVHGRVIVAHLGSGASLCAMREGRSIDTTMSFSVLDGLPMGTRCGSLDPGVVLHLLGQKMTPAQIEDLLYHRSGLLGISGVSNDLRDLIKAAPNNPRAAEAIDFFVYRIIREIGSLTAALGGLDGLVFTAGVGENSHLIRRRVCEALAWLNISIDPGANERGEQRISPAAASPLVWVIPTDEEGVIASHTLAVIRSGNRK